VSEIKLPVDDALWLLDFVPSFKECGDAQRLLRIAALIAEASGVKALVSEFWVRVVDYPPHKKVGTIKVIRELSNYGLKEAKDACELGSWFMVKVDKFDIISAESLLVKEGCTYEVSTSPP